MPKHSSRAAAKTISLVSCFRFANSHRRTAIIKAKGTSAALSDKVAGGGTIQDHRLRYAVDLDGDGIIEGANIGGESVNIRATAAVWCRGPKGVLIKSWTDGQTKDVN